MAGFSNKFKASLNHVAFPQFRVSGSGLVWCCSQGVREKDAMMFADQNQYLSVGVTESEDSLTGQLSALRKLGERVAVASAQPW